MEIRPYFPTLHHCQISDHYLTSQEVGSRSYTQKSSHIYNHFLAKTGNSYRCRQTYSWKQKEYVLFPDGFRRIKLWWPYWCWRIDERHFRSALAKNSIARTTNIFNWGTTAWLLKIGSERTFRNTKCSSWTSILSWGHFVQMAFHSHH